jgi:hypothetical protein
MIKAEAWIAQWTATHRYRQDSGGNDIAAATTRCYRQELSVLLPPCRGSPPHFWHRLSVLLLPRR